jgi:hypothetical protein
MFLNAASLRPPTTGAVLKFQRIYAVVKMNDFREKKSGEFSRILCDREFPQLKKKTDTGFIRS